jgi:8-amino-7-oxononanoate synthase
MTKNWLNYFQDILEKQKKANLFRELKDFKQGQDLYLHIQNKKLLNLASNNYLGLHKHPLLKQKSQELLDTYGTTAGASPLVSGRFQEVLELENTLARFKKTEKSLIFTSGYTANLGILSSLADSRTIVFSDKLNHASIVDGILLSRAKLVRYRHLDMEHLAWSLEKYKDHPRKIIVSDSIFSMDGDIAPLNTLVQLKKEYAALLMLDEAHATGIFGRGRGLAHHLKLEQEVDIHMGTFSKALASLGGYVCASKPIVSFLINKARSFIYSTFLPPAVIGANLAVLNLLEQNPGLGEKLLSLAHNLRRFLQELGFDTGNSSTQIIPVILKDPEKTLRAQKFLEEKNIFVPAIRPPTVPENTSRLRISLRLDLQDREMEQIQEAFKELKKVLC